MDIITIGDLHGSSAWKEINPTIWDHLVFLGDYVDSFDYRNDEILENLWGVIQLKNNFPKKVILLWGNHDLGYLFIDKPGHACSGFREGMARRLHEIFTVNQHLFQCAWQVENYLWTHAGIAGRWFKNYIEEKILSNHTHLSAALNRLFDEYYPPLFDVGYIRGGGCLNGGVFWADIMEMVHDPLLKYHQIIGHTKTGNGIITYTSKDNSTTVTCADCLETKTEFYELHI